MAFYLTFPLVLLLIKKYNINTNIFFGFSLLIYIITQAVLSNLLSSGFYKGFPSYSHDIIFYFPISHFCSFMLGVSGGLLVIRNSHYFNSQGFYQYIIFILSMIFMYFTLQNPDALGNLIGYPLAYSSSFYALIFLVFILGFVCSKNRITRVLSAPSMVFMGEISYGVYILQEPVHEIYIKYIAGLLGFDANWSFIFYVSLLLVVSWIVHLIIEDPCKSFILRLNSHISKVEPNKLIQQAAKAVD
jgi:peptidoglycan/LPS O-acetylase OafA/YrhL